MDFFLNVVGNFSRFFYDSLVNYFFILKKSSIFVRNIIIFYFFHKNNFKCRRKFLWSSRFFWFFYVPMFVNFNQLNLPHFAIFGEFLTKFSSLIFPIYMKWVFTQFTIQNRTNSISNNVFSLYFIFCLLFFN